MSVKACLRLSACKVRELIFIVNFGFNLSGSVSGEKSELLNNKVSKNQDPSGTSGGHKVRFDSVGDEDKAVRRLRGRNIFNHSDVEVGSSVAASVVSDNTHLYRRSRSAVGGISSFCLVIIWAV